MDNKAQCMHQAMIFGTNLGSILRNFNTSLYVQWLCYQNSATVPPHGGVQPNEAPNPHPTLSPFHQPHPLPHTIPNPMAPPSPILIYFDAIYLAIGLLAPFWWGFVEGPSGACLDGNFKSLSGPRKDPGVISPQPCRWTKHSKACFIGLRRGFQSMKAFLGG